MMSMILTEPVSLARALKSSSSLTERALLVGLCAAFAAYLVHSQFDVSYYDYKVLLAFWLLAGVAAALPSTRLRRV